MISKDLIAIFSEIAKEKNIDRTELGTIIEDLFIALVEKKYGDSSNFDIIVNIDKGEIEIYQEKTIVESVMDPSLEIELDDAQVVEPGLEMGDSFIEVIDPTTVFNRRHVTTAKQFLSQRIRDIEKKSIFEDYYHKVGEIVIGDVRQVQRDFVYIYIDQSEMRMPKEDQIESERYRRGDTIRCVIKSVEMLPKGPDIIVSRGDNQFLFKLFEMEVPEIEDGIVEILAISRSPGMRSKIIVRSSDRRIDPVGACVGMRGNRIQSIVRELNGEKIDVVNYSPQPEILITRALSPAIPKNLYIDDDKKYCLAVFDDEDIDSAAGKNYVNVRLAADVTRYTIDVVKESEHLGGKKDDQIILKDVQSLTPRMVKLLGEANINTVNDFRVTPEQELLDIKGMGQKTLSHISSNIDEFIEEQNNSVEDEEETEHDEIIDETPPTTKVNDESPLDSDEKKKEETVETEQS